MTWMAFSLHGMPCGACSAGTRFECSALPTSRCKLRTHSALLTGSQSFSCFIQDVPDLVELGDVSSTMERYCDVKIGFEFNVAKNAQQVLLGTQPLHQHQQEQHRQQQQPNTPSASVGRAAGADGPASSPERRALAALQQNSPATAAASPRPSSVKPAAAAAHEAAPHQEHPEPAQPQMSAASETSHAPQQTKIAATNSVLAAAEVPAVAAPVAAPAAEPANLQQAASAAPAAPVPPSGREAQPAAAAATPQQAAEAAEEMSAMGELQEPAPVAAAMGKKDIDAVLAQVQQITILLLAHDVSRLRTGCFNSSAALSLQSTGLQTDCFCCHHALRYMAVDPQLSAGAAAAGRHVASRVAASNGEDPCKPGAGRRAGEVAGRSQQRGWREGQPSRIRCKVLCCPERRNCGGAGGGAVRLRASGGNLGGTAGGHIGSADGGG